MLKESYIFSPSKKIYMRFHPSPTSIHIYIYIYIYIYLKHDIVVFCKTTSLLSGWSLICDIKNTYKVPTHYGVHKYHLIKDCYLKPNIVTFHKNISLLSGWSLIHDIQSTASPRWGLHISSNHRFLPYTFTSGILIFC